MNTKAFKQICIEYIIYDKCKRLNLIKKRINLWLKQNLMQIRSRKITMIK